MFDVTGTFAVEVMETNASGTMSNFSVCYGHLCCRGYGNLKTTTPSPTVSPSYGHLCCRGYGNYSLSQPLLRRRVTGTFAVEVMETLGSCSRTLICKGYGHLCCRGYGNPSPLILNVDLFRYGHLCCRGYGNDSPARLRSVCAVTGTFAVEVMETFGREFYHAFRLRAPLL